MNPHAMYNVRAVHTDSLLVGLPQVQAPLLAALLYQLHRLTQF